MSQLNLMALRHSAFYSPFLMTMAGGYLKHAGFDVNYTLQTPDNLVVDRLQDGSCQVSQSAVAASFAALEANQENPIRHFAQINSRDGFFIASRQAIKNFEWTMLREQTVLVDHFFQPLAMFKYALHKKGIQWDQLKVIDAGNVEEIDQAFRSGLGSFVHQQGPAPQQMQSDGIAQVVASVGNAIGPVAFSSLCSTQDWLDTEEAQIFYTIYRKTLQECQQNESQDIAQQLQAYGFLKEIKSTVLTETIETYQKLGCWNHNGEIKQAEYETLLDVFQYSGLISKRYDYCALIKTL